MEAVSSTPGEVTPFGTRASAPPRPWAIGFLALHLACQVSLIIPQLSGMRLVARMAAFATSLAFLVLLPPRVPTWKVPMRNLAVLILVLLCLEFFHPDGSGPIAAAASITLNLAVLAPIFWMPRADLTVSMFQRVISIIWLYYTAGAVLGVLQAYYPGRFEPPLAATFMNRGDFTQALQIHLTTGEWIYRPMGLTDSPGGAAHAGLYAVLLGMGMVLSPKAPFFGARVLAGLSMVAGMMCLCLCQIRSLVVMTGICVVALSVLLLISGRVPRLLGLLAVLGAAIPGAFTYAAAVGGTSMINRLTSLIDADPGTVYYSHRGFFLDRTINYFLPLYPLGAGLGRCGMVHAYFGNATDGLWAEIQWTVWLFEGGVPMIVLYSAAIIVVSLYSLQVARGRIGGGDPTLTLWGAVLVAYNVGTIAVCFNYATFSGTEGVEFWFLNMALLCAAYNAQSQPLQRKVAA